MSEDCADLVIKLSTAVRSPLEFNAEQKTLLAYLAEQGVAARPIPFSGRSAEASALLSLAASAVSVLISGLCAIIAARGGQKIVIKTVKGGQIEVPANTDPKRIQELLRMADPSSFVEIREV